MSIKQFSFKDNDNGWKLTKLVFDDLNLLVGLSGVGKSRILKALGAVHRCAVGANHGMPNCEWTLVWEVDGHQIQWEAKTSRTARRSSKSSQLSSANQPTDDESIPLVSESLTVNDNLIVRRTGEDFIFNGSRLPKLKNTESAISLLSNEDQLAPLYQSAQRIAKSEAARFSEEAIGVLLDRVESECINFEELCTLGGLPIVARVFFCQREYPAEFEKISTSFMAIFPSVEQVRFGLLQEFGLEDGEPELSSSSHFITFAIQEAGVKGWVLASGMSSGMKRTLLHLAEIVLSPPNTVLMIDEYENGLGVNCLNELTEFLIQHRGNIQLILTSHHPYVIGNIPMSAWKIVTRKGSTVSVKSAQDIPELQGRSRQDSFIRLINSEAFEGGLQ